MSPTPKTENTTGRSAPATQNALLLGAPTTSRAKRTILSNAIAAIDLKPMNEQTLDYDQVQPTIALFTPRKTEYRMKILKKHGLEPTALCPPEMHENLISPPFRTTVPNSGSDRSTRAGCRG